MSIRLERGEHGIATVLMDRPAKRNAFTLQMYREFGEVFDQLNADDSVRCIVVRGAGGAFCAGSDIGGFDESRSGAAQAREYAEFTLAMTDRLKLTPHPTVACIEGACVGGGLEIAAMCDIRVAGRSARFGVPINRIGLTLDYRELADLLALLGGARTLEILLEGGIFGADEALSKGLVTRVVDDDVVAGQAYEAARRVAAGAPLVNRWHKQFVRRLQAGGELAEAELAQAYACFDTEDYRKGQRAFLNKEKPVFAGR
ncbi:enoyl-CoA hydratase/isomerase family protein [Bordetella hinzii]|uniref:Enoyl-CoA hydratase n=1 Tax=Bordetella hinzii TaxID=103855 RepID=A0AAN1RU94_9BORD|nr:enoyl-CoA hydratase-related protein [Bordetella hinzii]AKQ54270.1 1,2-epoxyphenylacetyl-CoA isomerase [Bordetella hinzii]AKQ58784.1 1,2-epoxyphenylacetyl-CoA isomerase [Bordetella hinzii]AZW15935.1 enoyl-CoA hydratase [Bordetella hinzii]KCB30836.1 enoyl-CoA hydratase/isomerase family protein [Bordetella hinzii L60]MBZ0075482.1 enoyl-CoA hydratase/isomerase family protein [Bordetella hinzii]